YERLINITDDPGVKDALGFLMTREIAHQKSFEKALYAIENNFPTGKLPGIERFASMYVNTSQGEGDINGPWNSGDEWDRVDDLEEVMPADDGDGTATVKLAAKDMKIVAKMGERTLSDPSSAPTTGADLGAGPGAGRTKNGDMGGAASIKEAPARAEATPRKKR
ncbi:MAG: manganese catalase family protein, partial [Mesorhizobium sp.]